VVRYSAVVFFHVNPTKDKKYRFSIGSDHHHVACNICSSKKWPLKPSTVPDDVTVGILTTSCARGRRGWLSQYQLSFTPGTPL